MEELQSTQEQLIDLNTRLEQRVLERTEELKFKNNELLKINTDLDSFIYTASHDLKSPISNIEGLTVLLNKRINGRLTEEEKKIFELIELSILKFKGTIADLTEITKAQKDLETKIEDISFKEIISDVKADIRNMLVESNAVVTEKLEVNNVIYAKTNLRSIIYNLLSNAIKYRSPDRLLQIDIRTYKEKEDTVLSITDNGLGISGDNLGKIFTMFKRLHAHVEGTGIGLYIIKRIIENKGGRIEVDSKLNEGTTFRVHLKS